ncbi:hypothetical protein F383_37652 [Gossypium arboreum]|nr:hypothetical protein F383_37652 [Gossypium arboreum]
MAAANS